MSRFLRLVSLAFALTVALVVPAGASAKPSSTTFAIRGFEYAFTPTVGYFAGSGMGNAGDRAAWNTRVEHDPLGSTPTFINGGSFQMATRSPAGMYDFVTGTFVYHGGMITTIDPGTNCMNQQFHVFGELEHVSTSTTSGGTGSFDVTLTHHRAPLLGRCFTYSASVVGTVSFSY